MNRWEEIELKRLSKRVERAIVKYGKTTILKELSEIVGFDHVHKDYRMLGDHDHEVDSEHIHCHDDHEHNEIDHEHHTEHDHEHVHANENKHDHNDCAECHEFHQNKHVVVERKTDEVQITCVDEQEEKK